MPIEALVPVAPGEPAFIVEESIDCLREAGLRPTYVADLPSGEVREAVEGAEGAALLERESCRGRRAGALNDGLEEVDTEFVAVMDVDSRPTPEFVESCLDELERRDDVYLASGPRRITNEGAGLVPRMVAGEYRLIGDMYRSIAGTGGFLQFNGLIGVARTSVLRELSLDESVACEDVELNGRAHLAGYRAALVEEEVGEQAAPDLGSLYGQRVRWLTGALESLGKQGGGFLWSRKAPFSVRVSWFTQVLAPVWLVLFSPLFPLGVLYGFRLAAGDDDRPLTKAALLPLLAYLQTLCSLSAAARWVVGRAPEWEVAGRT